MLDSAQMMDTTNGTGGTLGATAEYAEESYRQRLSECSQEVRAAQKGDRWLGLSKVGLGLVIAGALIWFVL